MGNMKQRHASIYLKEAVYNRRHGRTVYKLAAAFLSTAAVRASLALSGGIVVAFLFSFTKMLTLILFLSILSYQIKSIKSCYYGKLLFPTYTQKVFKIQRI